MRACTGSRWIVEPWPCSSKRSCLAIGLGAGKRWRPGRDLGMGNRHRVVRLTRNAVWRAPVGGERRGRARYSLFVPLTA